MMRLPAIVLLVTLLGLHGGCASTPKGPRPVPEGTPPPAYADIAARYNQRVAPLEHLSAATVTRIWYTDEQGQAREDQIEGRLTLVRPTDVYLRFDKLGETYAMLGSNSERYWWMELGETRTAWVGSHQHAAPDRVADFGVPVHPINLIELLGVTPLPESGEASQVAWSPDRRNVQVSVPRGDGRVRLTLDRTTFEPNRVELLNAVGDVMLASELSTPVPVDIFGHRPPPRVAGEVNIALAQPHDVRVRLRMAEPATSPRQPRRDLFNFELLVDRYRVGDIISLDDDPADAPSVPHATTGPEHDASTR